MAIRNATTEDVARMAELSRTKRAEYETYSPIFWKMADSPDQAHALYLRKLVDNDDAVTLVSEDKGMVNGFLIGSLVDAPTVYDPGGKICMIDDYVVDGQDLWSSVGLSLLERCRAIANAKGCVLQVIVCGQKDRAKSNMLKEANAEVASEWYVRPIT